MISSLKPAAEMADRLTEGTRSVRIVVLAAGIMVEAIDFVCREGMEHAQRLRYEDHLPWSALDVAGIDIVLIAIGSVVERVERAKAKA